MCIVPSVILLSRLSSLLFPLVDSFTLAPFPFQYNSPFPYHLGLIAIPPSIHRRIPRPEYQRAFTLLFNRYFTFIIFRSSCSSSSLHLPPSPGFCDPRSIFLFLLSLYFASEEAGPRRRAGGSPRATGTTPELCKEEDTDYLNASTSVLFVATRLSALPLSRPRPPEPFAGLLLVTLCSIEVLLCRPTPSSVHDVLPGIRLPSTLKTGYVTVCL